MPPKYYCDYCDKTFHDTPASRKRHTQGAQHQRAKKLWFDSHKDPEDGKAGLCSYFMRTGTCQYGQHCKYLHHIPPTAGNLGINVRDANIYGQMTGTPSATLSALTTFGEVGPTSVTENTLPLSLQPPPEGGYPQFPFVDWG